MLDAGLNIVYCNPAWDRFAAENDGEKCRFSLLRGRHLLEGVPQPLTRFFITAFDAVRDSGQPFEFDYECSSALFFRTFRMRILPVQGEGEYLVWHSLRVERPHDRAAVAPDDRRYRSSDGVLVMCCHCRRTRRSDASEAWDWVPDYVASHPARVSTGICPACYLYFYPEIFAARAAGTAQ